MLKMAEVIKNRKAMERKHFLMRALSNKQITEEDYDTEIKSLNKEITANLQEILAEEHEKLKDEVLQIKKTVYTDGDMKRGIARVLIKFLRLNFSSAETRGILRQGYKIMRKEEK